MSSFKKASPVPDSLVDGVWNQLRREENFRVEEGTTAQDILAFFDKKRKTLERKATKKDKPLKYGFRAIDSNRQEFVDKLTFKLDKYKQAKVKTIHQRHKSGKEYTRGWQKWTKEEEDFIEFRKTMPKRELIYEAYVRRFQGTYRTKPSIMRKIIRRQKNEK
jgi:hypothetical protein